MANDKDKDIFGRMHEAGSHVPPNTPPGNAPTKMEVAVTIEELHVHIHIHDEDSAELEQKIIALTEELREGRQRLANALNQAEGEKKR